MCPKIVRETPFPRFFPFLPTKIAIIEGFLTPFVNRPMWLQCLTVPSWCPQVQDDHLRPSFKPFTVSIDIIIT